MTITSMSVMDVTKLRALTGLIDGQSLELLGYNTPGDGGGGSLRVDGSDTITADDGGLTFVAADGMRIKRAIEFFVTPHMFGVVDGQESGARLQAYLDALGAANNPYQYDMTCSTISNQLISIRGGSKKKTIYGYLDVTAGVDVKDDQNRAFVTVSNCNGWYFKDGFMINGYTSHTGTKKIIDGLALDGCRQTVIERVEGRGGEGFLVTILDDSNDNMSTIKKLIPNNFGWKPGMGKNRPYTYIGGNGQATTSVNYRSIIQIDLDEFFDYQIINGMLWIQGSPHWITNYDRIQQQATLYPGFTSGYDHGENPLADVIFGGGLYTRGGDSGELKVDSLVATNCGIAYADRSLYGAVVSRLTTQSCGAGYLCGNAPTSVGGYGTVILQPYFENNSIDLISISTAGGANIIAPIALSSGKCFRLEPPGRTGNVFVGTGSFNIVGFRSQTPGAGRWYNEQEITVVISSSYSVDTVRPIVFNGNGVSRSRTITLQRNGLEVNRGFHSRSLTFFGVPGAFEVVGQSGYTVNGQASLNFASIPDGMQVKAFLYGSDWKVMTYYAHSDLSSSIAYAPDPLNNGDSAIAAVPVAGAALGDFVDATFDVNLQGMEMRAWVSSSNTVTVRIKNDTGVAIALASGTLRCRVRKL